MDATFGTLRWPSITFVDRALTLTLSLSLSLARAIDSYGVREHAMGAIVNGLSAYGGIYPYGSTFLNFLGYMLGAWSSC